MPSRNSSNRRKALELQLVQLAAGALPLCLVPEILAQVWEQDSRRETGRRAGDCRWRACGPRRARSSASLAEQDVARDTVKLVRKLLDADRRARCKKSDVPQRAACLGIGPRSAPSACANGMTANYVTEAAELLRRVAPGRRATWSPPSTRSAAIPDDADVAQHDPPASGDDEGTRRPGRSCEATRRGDRRSCSRSATTFSKSCWLANGSDVERELADEQAARMVKLAVRTQETMRRSCPGPRPPRSTGCRSASRNRSVFFFARRRSSTRCRSTPRPLPSACSTTHGQTIPKHRLSEGEKQVFAVSVLWGLAQSSPRPLPAIIDTPMARLDSEHRLHLIERYFPNASHQVIILSTDTEVDQNFYAKLQPHITRAYHLDYDESEKATVAREGYFWKCAPGSPAWRESAE